MKKKTLIVGAVLSSALVMVACTAEDRTYQGGSGGHGGSGTVGSGGAGGQVGQGGQGGQGNDPAIAAACDVFAKNVCDRYASCAPGVIAGLFGDDATCHGRYVLYCTSILKAPGTGWTPQAIADCSSAYLSLDCNLYISQPFRAVDELTPPSCVPPPGALPDGASCLDAGQCQSGNCHHPIGAFCGVCGPKAQSGEACSTNLDCAPHNICWNGACQPAGEPGDACAPQMNPCNFPWDCFGGACAKPGLTGETCNGNGPACSFFAGYYCEPSTSQCQAFDYTSSGAACGPMMGAHTLCAGSGHCVNGACIDHAPDGAPCDPMLGAVCMSPSFCINGACEPPNAAACK